MRCHTKELHDTEIWKESELKCTTKNSDKCTAQEYPLYVSNTLCMYEHEKYYDYVYDSETNSVYDPSDTAVKIKKVRRGDMPQPTVFE